MILIRPLNEDGYIMIFVLIVTSILLVLGLMTMTISQTNYKMKQINSQGKKNFYIAEALVEESDMKLHSYVRQALDYSYGVATENQSKSYVSDEINQVLTYEKTNHFFETTYKSEINKLTDVLENINNYSIKTIEGYNVNVDIKLKECKIEDVFNLSVISNYEDTNIVERIETKYIINIPEYKDYNEHNELVSKIGWRNYKW